MYSASQGLPEIRELYSQPATVKGHFRTLRNCSPFPCFVHKDRWPPPEPGNLPAAPPPPRCRSAPTSATVSPEKQKAPRLFPRPTRLFIPPTAVRRCIYSSGSVFHPGSRRKGLRWRDVVYSWPADTHLVQTPSLAETAATHFTSRAARTQGGACRPAPLPPTLAPEGLRLTAGGGD
ncbi:uncharacterized protein AAG666_002382 [Megaptera novaeangliae]